MKRGIKSKILSYAVFSLVVLVVCTFAFLLILTQFLPDNGGTEDISGHLYLIYLATLALAAGLSAAMLYIGRLLLISDFKPLQDLVAQVQETGPGDPDHRVEVSDEDEAGLLAAAFNKTIDSFSLELKSLTREKLESKLAGAALTKELAYYRGIFENAAGGIFQAAMDGKFLRVNRSMSTLFGYESPGVMLKNASYLGEHIFAEGELRSQFKTQLQENGYITNFEMKGRRQDDVEFDIFMNMNVVNDANGNPQFFEGVLFDITQKRAADKVKAAQRYARIRSEFLAVLNLEFSAPLNSVVGFSELLDTETANERGKEYIAAINSGANTLKGQMEDILDLSRIESGKLELQYSSVNPIAILKDIRAVFTQQVACKKLDFLVEIGPNLQERLELDKYRIFRVLYNLVTNAVKYTEKGYIKLSINRRFPDKNEVPMELVFSVKDTGIGMGKEKVVHIFDDSAQTKNGEKFPGFGDAGFALSLSRRLVELMGGKMYVESEPGKGSTFYIKLKNIEISPYKDETKAGPVLDIDAIDFERATILVADNVKFNRDLLRYLLEFTDITILEAKNVKALVDAAMSSKPDLILVDMEMPGMDRYEAIKKLRNNESSQSVPIIAVTASALEKSAKIIAESGCDGFLKKPISRIALLEEVRRFLPHSTSDPSSRKGALRKKEKAYFVDVITPELRAVLPELVELLESSFVDKWNTVCQTFDFNEIVLLARQVEQVGKKYKLQVLKDWSTKLQEQAKAFDMERLPATLDYFLKIIEKLIIIKNS
ncbi:MAG: response regulator [bacterium]|nr:response regulator [bacterium]